MTFLPLLGLVLAAPPAVGPREPALTAAHWAFRLPRRNAIPSVGDPRWPRTPVDTFVLAGLDRAGLRPAAPADRRTLVRRVTWDLTGLPPTPAEVEEFLKDTRPDAYVHLVDRLLASPHFGERWAQHWLDVVRYAETNGYEADGERPHAWRYRDYVVRAFNEDRPFNRFLTEQLAGDLLDDPTALIAAGFNRCGPVHETSGNVDAVVGRQEVLTEMTTAVGAAVLGLTVGCARCHDHKFDPISQADYYRLQAFFSATRPYQADLSTAEEQAEHKRRTQDVATRLTPLRKQLTTLDAPYQQRLQEAKKARLEAPYREALATAAGKRTPEQRKLVADAENLIKVTWDEIVAALTPADAVRRTDLRRQIHDLEGRLPPPVAHAWTVREDGGARVAAVLQRGDPKRPGAEVRADFPRVLRAESKPEDKARDRRDLAAWLTRPDHPLTARVIVNRLWQHHFGRGLVATPNDFGTRGTRPTHPELLDWLACELVDSGWSLKHVHRLMVLSATYQQGSRGSKNEDPENRLLSRMNRRRLEGESLRDGVLAVAGSLNPRLGGPAVRVPLEPEVYDLIFTEGEPDGLWPVTPDAREHTRRSLYLFNKRNVRLPLLEAFDQPDTLTPCPARPVSTFAPQALILLNGTFLQEQSRAFAARVLHEAPADDAARIDWAYRLALARPPRPEELRSAREFLEAQTALIQDRLPARLPTAVPAQERAGVSPAMAAALADFCLALLNRNEFVYVD